MARAPICECSSIIPAVKCLPLASTIFEPADFRLVPILMIFPFFIKTSVFLRTASPVQTVAFLNKVFSCFGFVVFPYPILG